MTMPSSQDASATSSYAGAPSAFELSAAWPPAPSQPFAPSHVAAAAPPPHGGATPCTQPAAMAQAQAQPAHAVPHLASYMPVGGFAQAADRTDHSQAQHYAPSYQQSHDQSLSRAIVLPGVAEAPFASHNHHLQQQQPMLDTAVISGAGSERYLGAIQPPPPPPPASTATLSVILNHNSHEHQHQHQQQQQPFDSIPQLTVPSHGPEPGCASAPSSPFARASAPDGNSGAYFMPSLLHLQDLPPLSSVLSSAHDRHPAPAAEPHYFTSSKVAPPSAVVIPAATTATTASINEPYAAYHHPQQPQQQQQQSQYCDNSVMTWQLPQLHFPQQQHQHQQQSQNLFPAILPPDAYMYTGGSCSSAPPAALHHHHHPHPHPQPYQRDVPSPLIPSTATSPNPSLAGSVCASASKRRSKKRSRAPSAAPTAIDDLASKDAGGSGKRLCRIRPPLPYPMLLATCLLEAPDGRLTLREVYAELTRRYPDMYGPCEQFRGWQNTVRYNLSRCGLFEKLARHKVGATKRAKMRAKKEKAKKAAAAAAAAAAEGDGDGDGDGSPPASTGGSGSKPASDDDEDEDGDEAREGRGHLWAIKAEWREQIDRFGVEILRDLGDGRRISNDPARDVIAAREAKRRANDADADADSVIVDGSGDATTRPPTHDASGILMHLPPVGPMDALPPPPSGREDGIAVHVRPLHDAPHPNSAAHNGGGGEGPLPSMITDYVMNAADHHHNHYGHRADPWQQQVNGGPAASFMSSTPPPPPPPQHHHHPAAVYVVGSAAAMPPPPPQPLPLPPAADGYYYRHDAYQPQQQQQYDHYQPHQQPLDQPARHHHDHYHQHQYPREHTVVVHSPPAGGGGGEYSAYSSRAASPASTLPAMTIPVLASPPTVPHSVVLALPTSTAAGWPSSSSHHAQQQQSHQ
ncbi:hypothetical protein H9P43_009957 [Blastocladiella emersonii ATCC 22665]|nr:hypothetical protein H9P43_009957 [Blastocladiella emersonii ATCC 22665]